MVTKPNLSRRNRAAVNKKMQKKSLTDIFEKEPDSYPESICFQDGLTDYIEDIVWDEKPYKCSEENRTNIEKVLNSHPSQRENLKPLLDFEHENGKGSSRRDNEKAASQVKDIYQNILNV